MWEWHSDELLLRFDSAFEQSAVVSSKLLNFGLVLRLFRVVHREHFHEVVGRVCKTGNRPVDHLEVFYGPSCITLEDDVAISHKNEFVEEKERLGTGLVDGRDDGLALSARHIVQQLDDTEGFEAIQACSWIVEQDNRRIRDQLHTDRSTLAFTSRDNFSLDRTDLRVGNEGQTQGENNLFHEGILLCIWNLEFEASGESHGLTNREVRKQRVELLDVGSIASEHLLIDWDSVVEQNVAT